MTQKIRLGPDGTVVPKRMQPFSSGGARATPAIKLTRLQELLKTKSPRICVVRGEGLGDVLMTTPTVRALRQTFGSMELHYATNTRYLGGALVKALSYNPDIDEILERELLDERKYDVVINLHCPAVAYEVPANPPLNRIDIFANHSGVRLQDTHTKYFIQQSEIDTGADIIRPLLNRKVILVQPFASTERRSINPRKLRNALARLSNELGTTNIILTHGSDFPSEIQWDTIPHTSVIHNLDVRGIAGLMVHCDMVLCQDSSILHLAGALDVPTVSIFGPTHPDARINYYKDSVAIWKGRELAPCPCWYTHCPISYACWAGISEDDIVQTVATQLSSTTKVDISKLVQGLSKIKTEMI